MKSPVLNSREEFEIWKAALGDDYYNSKKEPMVYPCVITGHVDLDDHNEWYMTSHEFVYLRDFADKVEAYFLNGDNDHVERIQYKLDRDYDLAVELADDLYKGEAWGRKFIPDVVSKWEKFNDY